MTDVVSFHKAEPAPCACGCGVIGRPRRKAWADGIIHNRNCECRRCKSSTYRKKEEVRVVKLARRLHSVPSPMSGALNGADITGFVDVEETTDESVVRGFRRWSRSTAVMRKRARLDARPGTAPKVLIIQFEGESWSVLRTDDFVQLVDLAWVATS